jgi:iron complex outermembrane recepter protein
VHWRQLWGHMNRALVRAASSAALCTLAFGKAIADAGPHSAGALEGASEASSSTAESQLQEVLVTARRREESSERVPISLVTLGQEALTAGGIKDIADLAQITPGLQFSQPSGFLSTINSVSIRGLNNDTGQSTVGVYLDDTPLQGRLSVLSVAGNPYPDIFDLNRVEVARGPQGTLFGAGSEAGTVRFITNQPSVTEFSGFTHGEAAVTYGGAPSYEVGAAGGGPIVPGELGFRVSAWARQDGGYVDLLDPTTGSLLRPNSDTVDKAAFRAAILFQSDNLRITPDLHYQIDKRYNTSRFWSAFSNPAEGDFANAPLAPEVSTDSFWLPSLKIEAKLPFADLVSTTSYLTRSVHASDELSAYIGSIIGGYGSPLGVEVATSHDQIAPSYKTQSLTAVTQEVRFASTHADAFVSWVGGVFYDHRVQQDHQVTYDSYLDPTGAAVYDVNQQFTDSQFAVYAQLDFHLSRKLTATVGERIADLKVDYQSVAQPGLFDIGVPPLTKVSSNQTPSTPRFALSYQADRDDLFYISVSKGFRAGGGNAGAPDFCVGANVPTTYSSDYDWSYEVGAKNSFFGGRVHLDTSAFYMTWSQIQQLVALSCGFSYIVNGGDAVSKGFDLALQALLLPRLLLSVNAAYVDAHFTSDVAESGKPLVQDGDKIGFLPNVTPPWSVNVLAKYDIPLSSRGSMYVRSSYQYDSRNPGPFLNHIPGSLNYYPDSVPNPATHWASVRLGYKRDNFDISLFMNNVFNSNPLLDQYQNSSSATTFYHNTFRPRTTGLAANYTF